MGRKRKRSRKVEPLAERLDLEPADAEVEGEDEDAVTANAPMAEPSAAGEREEVPEAMGEEDIGELLEPFTRDELLDLLTDACLRDPALLARLAASAASDAAHRRLFVHGLSPGATSAALAAAFAPFGALDECHAVADRATGRCRGYGFVTFRRRSERAPRARRLFQARGRPARCLPARRPRPVAQSSFSDRKLFVGNVPERASHDDLRGFFSKFGEIEEGPLGADRATGLFRGYAIFSYKTPEGLRKALEEPTKVFDGYELQCRRAYRVSNRKHSAAKLADTGVQRNGGAVAAVLPSVQAKDPALASKHSLASSNQPVGLMAKGSSSATATVALVFLVRPLWPQLGPLRWSMVHQAHHRVIVELRLGVLDWVTLLELVLVLHLSPSSIRGQFLDLGRWPRRGLISALGSSRRMAEIRAVPCHTASCLAVPLYRPGQAASVPRAKVSAHGTAHGPIFRAVPPVPAHGPVAAHGPHDTSCRAGTGPLPPCRAVPWAGPNPRHGLHGHL
ncbi:hypothetical protein HU200_009032 [Digitaria exilis]|uniref:RRM domain-containing protein n=1 Tax=Digitaria exilis TaxID=1010633 RepID=A0A835FLN3_9POAL|nr:hypothetical protein HU200_009032 [Digitaria exilis]